MNVRGLLIALLPFLIMLGCAEPAPVAEPETKTSEEAVQPSEDAMTMQGIDLYMHKRATSEGVSGKPELWIHAESLTIGDANTYHFENARAVIYGQEDVEEVVIEANRGSFQQDSNAVLEDEVKMTAGTLRMILSDIQWIRPEDESTGAAFSDSPVVIDDPDLQLKASGLRLYPDTQQFELNNVSGMVRFGGKLL